MKTCTGCKTDYADPLDKHFNKRSSTKDGYQSRCKACIAIFHKEHYQARKDYYKKKARVHNNEYRIRNLQYMVDYLKEHPCIDCGETDPVVLEFDHRKHKVCNVSEMATVSLDKVIKEIAKCDIRCANCHRRKTAIQRGFYKNITL